MNKHLQSRRKISEGKGGIDKLYKGKIYKLEGTLQKVQSEWTE
jgi:hypothetical protein